MRKVIAFSTICLLCICFGLSRKCIHFQTASLSTNERSVPALLISQQRVACKRRYPFVDPDNLCSTFLMPSGQSYFIALNLYNNEAIVLVLLVELLRLIQALRTCSSRARRVFVSIYESGSTDNTAMALKIFALSLKSLDIPHRVIVNGSMTRSAIPHRIKHLAKIRNAALQPFYQQPQGMYTQILFLNDILFCAEDALTLIQSQVQTSALMHCGLDYLYLNRPPRNYTYIGFYDYWVMRDRWGRQIVETLDYPWFRDSDAVSRTQVMSGYYRVPAFCCWNGMAVLSTHPFYEYGVRFRHGEYEQQHKKCGGCEIAYLCEDLWALYGNETRIYVNPSVHVAYNDHAYNGIMNTTWFKKSLIQQQQFQRQIRRQPLIKPPSVVTVPETWQCVSFANLRYWPFRRYEMVPVRVLKSVEKATHMRQRLQQPDEWYNDHQAV